MKTLFFIALCFLALAGCSSDDDDSQIPEIEKKVFTGFIGETFKIYYDDPNGYKLDNNNPDVASASFGDDNWLNIILKKEGSININVKDAHNNDITKIVILSSYFGATKLEETYVNPELNPDIVVEATDAEIIKSIKSEIMADIEKLQGSVFTFDKEKKEFTMNLVQMDIIHKGRYEWDINSLTLEYDGQKETFGFSIDNTRENYILFVNKTNYYQIRFPEAGITKVTHNRVLNNLYANPKRLN